MLQVHLMDYWSLYHKVIFDGIEKRIIITPGVTEINFKIDIYSTWKEWTKYDDNARYPQAMRLVGGDPLATGRYLGTTFFLMNGWRIRPWVGNYDLTVFGNIFTEEGDKPFVPTEEPCTVAIHSEVSEIVEMVTVETGAGGGAEPQEIWEYANRSLTDKAGFAPDSTSIATAVWNKSVRTLTSGTKDSEIDLILASIGDVETLVSDLADEAFGNWVLDPIAKTLTLYRRNNQILKVFNLGTSMEEVPSFVSRSGA